MYGRARALYFVIHWIVLYKSVNKWGDNVVALFLTITSFLFQFKMLNFANDEKMFWNRTKRNCTTNSASLLHIYENVKNCKFDEII